MRNETVLNAYLGSLDKLDELEARWEGDAYSHGLCVQYKRREKQTAHFRTYLLARLAEADELRAKAAAIENIRLGETPWEALGIAPEKGEA